MMGGDEMSAKMSKRNCAEPRCKDDHTLMSKFCLSHIHTNTEDGTLAIPAKSKGAKVDSQKTSVKAKKKAAPKKKTAPSKAAKAAPKRNSKGAKRSNLGLGNGTPAQIKAAQAAKVFPRIAWEAELNKFKKSKDAELSIELGSPGSAQVTRVRELKKPYARGLRIETVGAIINFFKKGGK
jgi:hypothetical protein